MTGPDEYTPVTSGLQLLLDDVAPRTEGALADYIPELAHADPELFGIALVSMDGHVYGVGDATVPFTIQSVSKPFVYALALGDLGLPEVLERVGAEPSGEAFNAIRLDPVSGRPPKPMVNAGALLTTSLVRGADPVERFARILHCLSAFAGRELTVDESLYASELGSASRNRALAYLMQSAGSLRADVEETIDVYCRQCSVAVTARDLAVMAATLANGGVNPVTGVAVVDDAVAVRALSIMATCGMYDFSGEWLLRVGLPAKSGVAGGLIAASPSEFGIGVFSPRLDERGNTVRGIAVARELSERFDLHLMHHAGRTAPVVYLSSQATAGDGRRVAIVGAQGDLEFAAAERLLWAIDEALGDGDGAAAVLLLDMHRVTRVHRIAELMLDRRLAAAAALGVEVGLVHQQQLEVQLNAGTRFDTRDAALAWCGVTST